MKKFTLLLTALIAVSMITVAQIKMYLHLEDGTRVEYIASRVDSITFDSQIVEPDDSDKPEEKPDANAHEYVDLGLPSGTKWATCNVGADFPEDYGDYFAWGETEAKSYYDWSTYKWCKGSYDTMTKYCTSSSDGTVDNKTTLDLSDDAAYVNLGSSWRMPTEAQLNELRTECTWTWITLNGVNGHKVTSKINGNSIFLPAAGYRDDSGLHRAGAGGYYWSRSLDTDYSDFAYYLRFDSVNVYSSYYSRSYGRSVRPVWREIFTLGFDANGASGSMSAVELDKNESKNIPANTFTRHGYRFIGWNTTADGTGTAYTEGQTISLTENTTLYAQWEKFNITGTANGHDYVDLGLPSGTKWATCNVGADFPEDYGDYFAWGETEPKEEYDLSTYKWHEGSYYTHTKYCTSSTYGKVDNKTTLDLADDAANANWGGNWRMPTKTEQDELINTNYTTWTWTTQNGVKGYIVTSKSNGNSIFLPAAGYRDFSDLWDEGFNGYYSSSSLYTDNSGGACRLYFESSYVSSGSYSLRRRGWSVRPVLAE
jgi:uncharacterized repeat protein (TIGR02543 family)